MNCVDGKPDCIALLYGHGNLPDKKKKTTGKPFIRVSISIFKSLFWDYVNRPKTFTIQCTETGEECLWVRTVRISMSPIFPLLSREAKEIGDVCRQAKVTWAKY